MSKANYPCAIIVPTWVVMIIVAATVVGCDTNSGNAPAAPTTSAPSPTVLTQAGQVVTATSTLNANNPCAEQRHQLTVTAMQSNPQKPPSAHATLAYCYEQANDHEQAIAEYKEAIATDPDSTVGYDYLGLGQVYEKMGRYDDALATYLALGELKPKEASNNDDVAREQSNTNHEMGYSSAAQLYFKKGLYRETVDALNKALSIDPHELPVVELRGDLYVALHEKDKAAADYIYVLQNDGVPYSLGYGDTGTVGLDPEDRVRIKQKLRTLGVAAPSITPYPTSTLDAPPLNTHIPDDKLTITPVPPLPTATPLHLQQALNSERKIN